MKSSQITRAKNVGNQIGPYKEDERRANSEWKDRGKEGYERGKITFMVTPLCHRNNSTLKHHEIVTARRPRLDIRRILVHPKVKVEASIKTDCVTRSLARTILTPTLGKQGEQLEQDPRSTKRRLRPSQSDGFLERVSSIVHEVSYHRSRQQKQLLY